MGEEKNTITPNPKNYYSMQEFNDVFKRDEEFRYRLLSRLQMDCEYYLGCGGRQTKHLWAGDEKKQTNLMNDIYDSLKEKPEWISKNEIEYYKNNLFPENQIVGKIKYFDSGEEMVFNNAGDYIKHIKDELYCNPDGFKATTISNDPQLRKDVDDLYFNEIGEENPHKIDYYTTRATESLSIYIDKPVKTDMLFDIIKSKGIVIAKDDIKNLPMDENNNISEIYINVKNGKIDWADEYELRDSATEEEVENIEKLSSLLDEYNRKRISDINLYSMKNGGMAIRCKIDGIQQMGKRLDKEDINNLNENTSREMMIMKYFKQELDENNNREINKTWKR